MGINSLNKLYYFLVTQANMIDFMTGFETINLVPLSNIDYRDKIRGTMISLSLGDACCSLIEAQQEKEIEIIYQFLKEQQGISLKGTDETEMTIIFAESLIINQGFNPEDLAERFTRQSITATNPIIEKFLLNYRDNRLPWYSSGIFSPENGGAIRVAPNALINYGDFMTLKMIGGIQTMITHRHPMALAASILQSAAIAYLLNTPAYSIENHKDILKFLEFCSKSIKGIENKAYSVEGHRGIVNLYRMISHVLPQWISEDLTVEKAKKIWGSSSHSLESVPLALFLFLKNPNDYNIVLKNCLGTKEDDALASMAMALCGAYLGFDNIPKNYTNKLSNLNELLVLSDRLFELSLKNKNNNPYRRMKDQAEMGKSQDELDKLLWKAIKYNKDKEYETAITYFEKLLEKNPDLKKNERVKAQIIEAYEGVGSRLMESECYEEALKYFKKALIYNLNHPVLLCDLAITYLNMEDFERAERYARRAVEIAPEYEVGKEILKGIETLMKKS